ncbi:MAG: IS66 family transposase zinc-finger binding domain-containing protein [Planctomycetota bacterium]
MDKDAYIKQLEEENTFLKKRGARNGHQPHLRELLPPERVTHHIELKPEVCPCGGTNLEKTSEEPLHHQVVDIPPIKPEVTEYVQYIYRCKDCGELIYQPLPDELKRKHFGPGTIFPFGSRSAGFPEKPRIKVRSTLF